MAPALHSHRIGREQRSDKFVWNEFEWPQAGPERKRGVNFRGDANNPAVWQAGGLAPALHSHRVGREQRSDKFVWNEFGRPQAGPERKRGVSFRDDANSPAVWQAGGLAPALHGDVGRRAQVCWCHSFARRGMPAAGRLGYVTGR